MQRVRRGANSDALNLLVRTHVVSTAADAMITVALAGSLFFNTSPDTARDRLALYLLLTLAPFAVAIAFIGRVVDRYAGAGPEVLVFTSRARAVLAGVIALNPLGPLMYPASFGVLVLGRMYAATKRAYVPATIPDEAELVAGNARLSRRASIAGVVGGAVAAGVLQLGGARAALALAVGLHLAAGALAGRCPAGPDTHGEGAPEVAPPATASRLPLATMATLRAATGVLWLTLAFAITADGSVLAGLVAIAVPAGSFAGTYVSPYLRRSGFDENLILCGCATLALAATATAAALGGRPGMFVLALGVALASSIARHAFDSVVQREVDDARRPRVFARVEAVLQSSWVGGALLATVTALTVGAVSLVIAGAFSAVLAISLLQMRRVRGEGSLRLRALAPQFEG